VRASLALKNGVLYVGRHYRTAHVRAYDLDGRELWGGFSFRDSRLARSEVAGLTVDDDRNVWIADTPVSRVRRFSVFGREIGGIGLPLDRPIEAGRSGGSDTDRAGIVREPMDVVARGDADGLRLVVAMGGERRHAVQVFDEAGRLVRSLRPMGRPDGRFQGVCRVAASGSRIYVIEAARRRIQVFREGEFHFSFGLDGDAEPRAVAPLEDGRLLLASDGPDGGLMLLSASGTVLRVLAAPGRDEGCVEHVGDAVVQPGGADARRRVVVIDRDGDRVQVFTLAGRCYGSFEARA